MKLRHLLAIASMLIALLAIIAFVRFSRGKRSTSNACRNARVIATELVHFQVENDGRFPDDWEELIAARGMDRAILQSPFSEGDEPGWQLLPPEVTFGSIKEPSRTIIAISRFRLPDGKRLALFADGHCESLTDEEIKELDDHAPEVLLAEWRRGTVATGARA